MYDNNYYDSGCHLVLATNISELQINSITVQLNGTIVECSDSQDMISASVTIKVSPGQTY